MFLLIASWGGHGRPHRYPETADLYRYTYILPFAPPLILGDLKPGNVLLDDRLDDPSGRELTAEEPLISGLSC